MSRVGRALFSVAVAASALVGCTAPEPSGGVAPSRTPSTRAPTPAPITPKSDRLLPNMRSLDAFAISIEQAGAERRLRFAAALANLGPGPLLLHPRGRGSCPRGQHRADQHIHRDANSDGLFQRRRDRATAVRRAGCMLEHPTHDHWHFDAMAAYSLTRPGESEPLVARDKVSFCLRDNTRIRGATTQVRREYFGDCTHTTPQGISPGWVDVYEADLDGQWLRLRPGVNGLLCLRLEADPLDLLAETDETDNATAVPLRVSGPAVRRLRGEVCA